MMNINNQLKQIMIHYNYHLKIHLLLVKIVENFQDIKMDKGDKLIFIIQEYFQIRFSDGLNLIDRISK